MKLIYCPSQLSEAANFLAERSPLKHKSSSDWLQEIYDTMVNVAKEDKYSMVGTGGYYISFSKEEDGAVDANVLVDPALGIDQPYIQINI